MKLDNGELNQVDNFGSTAVCFGASGMLAGSLAADVLRRRHKCLSALCAQRLIALRLAEIPKFILLARNRIANCLFFAFPSSVEAGLALHSPISRHAETGQWIGGQFIIIIIII